MRLINLISFGGIKPTPYTDALKSKVILAGGLFNPTLESAFKTFEGAMGSELVKYDRLNFYGVNNSIAAIYDFINPTITVSAVASPTWTNNYGFTGNGTSSYINTRFNQLTSGTNYTQNSNSFGAYFLINKGATTEVNMGLSNGSNLTYLMPNNAGSFYFVANQGTNTTTTGQNTSGLISVRRTSSTNVEGYRNSSLISSITVSSVALISQEFFLGAYNASGSAAGFSSNPFAFSYMASGDINVTTLYNAVQAFATTMGWAV